MAGGKAVKLLDFWASPFGMRCRIALAEKEIEYEFLEQNLQDKSELLLKSNPVHKKIPVLIHDGRAICESLIIVQYIDEVFPGSPSSPPTPTRAYARFWADFVDRKVHSGANQMWKLKKERSWRKRRKRTYFGGDEFGLVDITLVPYTPRFYSFEVFAGLSVEKECPRLAAWGKRCGERESVAKVLPDPMKAHEYFCTRRKKLGID
ncbi:hypothetical protein HPP92_000994 [Vanilla planifolia]|uniref:glutathione transferase n=1 Tax=Vanilla planifolia TaxID=51239 RepID=A0A835RT68_VANPL|nr:hypothetical protein HPP92_000994 [Vanilla planifolia]